MRYGSIPGGSSNWRGACRGIHDVMGEASNPAGEEVQFAIPTLVVIVVHAGAMKDE